MERPALYVVATPIGNKDDITLRAIECLREVDFVICEEARPGSSLLKSHGITKPLEQLNEHNEKTAVEAIVERLLTNIESAALITDAGTPAFADPGARLVHYCHRRGVKVIPIPGVSSLMAAWSVAGVMAEKFIYRGFLPPQQDGRKEALHDLQRWNQWDIAIMETPYRLQQLLKDMAAILGENREIVLAYALTQPGEEVYCNTLGYAVNDLQELPKAPFVIILKREKKRRTTGPKKQGFRPRNQS
jgi:16S rRNA (cytidine1402-2'-O)-methyltransferase